MGTDGSLFFSLHQFYETRERVVRVDRGGEISAFPSEEISTGRLGDSLPTLDAVMGIRGGQGGMVWMLDNGRRGETLAKVVGWDPAINRLHQIRYLPSPATLPTSFVADFAVDPVEPFIYISDPASGDDAAIIVLNLQTGMSRRVLQGHSSVVPENIPLIVQNQKLQVLRPDGSIAEPLAGVNPITIDRRGRWLYYGPMKGQQLYRISTTLLQNDSAPAAEIEQGVESYSAKPICDSIAIDARDFIYVADLTESAIRVIQPKDRRMETYLKDPKLSWPDGLTFGNDGRLYFFCSQIHRSAVYNGGQDSTSAPFPVYRIKPQHQPLLSPKRNPLTGITESITDRFNRD